MTSRPPFSKHKEAHLLVVSVLGGSDFGQIWKMVI